MSKEWMDRKEKEDKSQYAHDTAWGILLNSSWILGVIVLTKLLGLH